MLTKNHNGSLKFKKNKNNINKEIILCAQENKITVQGFRGFAKYQTKYL